VQALNLHREFAVDDRRRKIVPDVRQLVVDLNTLSGDERRGANDRSKRCPGRQRIVQLARDVVGDRAFGSECSARRPVEVIVPRVSLERQ
jgi:hypothetical protein